MIYQLNNNTVLTNLLGGEALIKIAIAKHLKSLSVNDRYTRFFNGINDYSIDNYVSKLSFIDDGIIIFYSEQEVYGFVHVAKMKDEFNSYECGLSVNEHCRKQHIGSKLFNKAVEWAKSEGCNNLYLNCLYQNIGMNKIVKNYNVNIKSEGDGTNSAKIEMPGAIDIQALIKLKAENTILVWDLAYKKQLNRLFNFVKH